MKKYIDYITQFQDGNVNGIKFIENNLAKYLQENQENQTEIEHILDYLYSHPKLDISKIGYTTISAKAEKWMKKLQTLSTKDTEVEGTDYVVDFDFGDGYRMVKLLSQEAYNREGKLMSHCVSSYYGRDEVIYSLRDANNKPHCTISDASGQIKGKGNGSIDPKYIDYIIRFLESKEIEVSENDMKNLGYYKLSSIDTDITCDVMYKDYVYVNNIDKIKDKEGNIYCGFGLWGVCGLFTFDLNLKFKINVDIKSTIKYIVDKIVGDSAQLASSGHSAQLASSGHSAKLASSGHYAKLASSGSSAQLASSGDSAKLASSGHYAKLASSGDSAKLASSGHYAKLASSGSSAQLASSGDSAQLASSGSSAQLASSGDSAQLASSGSSAQLASSGHYAKLASSGSSAQLASSGDSAQLASSGHYAQLASSGDSAKLASSGSSAQLDIQGANSVGANIGIRGIIKGVIGSRITLAEYDNEGNCICVKSEKIDGKKIKADTRYKLEGKKFVETTI